MTYHLTSERGRAPVEPQRIELHWDLVGLHSWVSAQGELLLSVRARTPARGTSSPPAYHARSIRIPADAIRHEGLCDGIKRTNKTEAISEEADDTWTSLVAGTVGRSTLRPGVRVDAEVVAPRLVFPDHLERTDGGITLADEHNRVQETAPLQSVGRIDHAKHVSGEVVHDMCRPEEWEWIQRRRGDALDDIDLLVAFGEVDDRFESRMVALVARFLQALPSVMLDVYEVRSNAAGPI